MAANDNSCLEFGCEDTDLVERMVDDHKGFILLFDPTEVRAKVGGFHLTDEFDTGDGAGLSIEEQAWRKRLHQILDDSKGPLRRLLVAGEKMLSDIDQLELESPHFKSVIGLVRRAAKLSFKTQSPLAIPPLLLVGPPGLGKTYFARRLAEIIGTKFEKIAGDLLSDRGTLTGLSISWRAARPGRIASALLESSTASPVILIDEVDKVSAIHQAEKPLSFLHSVLEPENARTYQDEYLAFAMRADHIIWVLTANSVDELAPSIIDRLTVFSIEQPPPEMSAGVIRLIYASVNARFGKAFNPDMRGDVVNGLLEINPRRARKVIEIAFGYAMDANREFLTLNDIQNAEAVLAEGSTKIHSFGFL